MRDLKTILIAAVVAASVSLFIVHNEPAHYVPVYDRGSPSGYQLAENGVNNGAFVQPDGVYFCMTPQLTPCNPITAAPPQFSFAAPANAGVTLTQSSTAAGWIFADSGPITGTVHAFEVDAGNTNADVFHVLANGAVTNTGGYTIGGHFNETTKRQMTDCSTGGTSCSGTTANLNGSLQGTWTLLGAYSNPGAICIAADLTHPTALVAFNPGNSASGTVTFLSPAVSGDVWGWTCPVAI